MNRSILLVCVLVMAGCSPKHEPLRMTCIQVAYYPSREGIVFTIAATSSSFIPVVMLDCTELTK